MDTRIGNDVKGLPGYSEMRARFREMVEESTVHGGCACGGFVFEGALRDERDAFRAHVELCHPERLAALDAKRKVQRVARPSKGHDFAVLRELGVAA